MIAPRARNVVCAVQTLSSNLTDLLGCWIPPPLSQGKRDNYIGSIGRTILAEALRYLRSNGDRRAELRRQVRLLRQRIARNPKRWQRDVHSQRLYPRATRKWVDGGLVVTVNYLPTYNP